MKNSKDIAKKVSLMTFIRKAGYEVGIQFYYLVWSLLPEALVFTEMFFHCFPVSDFLRICVCRDVARYLVILWSGRK